MDQIIGIILKVIPIAICMGVILWLMNRKEKISNLEERKEYGDFTPKGQISIRKNARLLLDPIHEKFAIVSPQGTKVFCNQDIRKCEIIEYGKPILTKQSKAQELTQTLLRNIVPEVDLGKGRKGSKICSKLVLKIDMKDDYIIEEISNQDILKDSIEYQQIKERADRIVQTLKGLKNGQDYATTKEERKETNIEYSKTMPKNISQELKDKLQELEDLKTRGVINQTEYEETKRRLWNSE